MSPIASIGSGREIKVGRVAAPAVADAASQSARPLPASTVAPDAARDPRFDTATKARAVQQVVQQIAGLAYGAHVSVVSTGTIVHATIDISG